MSRDPEIAFACPSCGGEATTGLDGDGSCTRCEERPRLDVSQKLREQRVVERCTACDSTQLYVQRDFNQRAGLVIVVIGAVLAPFTPYYSSLFVAAAIDAVLYMLLPEITVCYRCHAHFRGFAKNPEHEIFDLHIAEQYSKPSSP